MPTKQFIRSDGYEYNASRLYAGYNANAVDGPFSPKQRNVFSIAASMAMPEEWYTEMFDAYKTYSANYETATHDDCHRYSDGRTGTECSCL